MKKSIALILSVIMVLSLFVSVFADTTAPETGSITIKNPQEGITYKAYKIFDLAYEDTNPAVPSSSVGGYPYSYYIDSSSVWLTTVSNYATDDDVVDSSGITLRGTGLSLDPVYDTDGTIKGYNVSYDKYFDVAKFAETLKDAIYDTGDAGIDFDSDGTKTGLEFGYYLVEPSQGALASLTSTDPDVVISDKNEQPKVDKVIVEDEIENRPLFGDTDPKYEAFELFHKTKSNTEWGANVNASAFNTALGANSALDSLYTSTFGEPDYTTNPGNTAARKWSEVYDAANEADYIAAAKDYLIGSSSNALNPVNAGSTYLVKMTKNNTFKGYAIVTANENGLLDLDRVEFLDGSNKTSYEEPAELKKAELEGLTNEVKATGASIGETLKFKLVTKVPDMTGYKDYFFVMNDTMDKGFTIDSGSIEVYLNKNKNDDPTETADALTIDDDYTVQVTPISSTGATEIRIIFKDMLQYWSSNEEEDLEGEPITVKYEATVNQFATLTKPNMNIAFMEFSNNPAIDVEYTPDTDGDEPSYDPKDPLYKNADGSDITEDIVGEGPEDSTETYVGEITLTKIDGKDTSKKLAGAKFKITGESYQVILFEGSIFEKDANGTWYLLKDGTYTEIAPSSESTYTEFDGKVVEYVAVDDDPAIDLYYFDTDGSEYVLIDGTNVTVAMVPENAVIYNKKYVTNLYTEVAAPTGTTIDDMYAAIPGSDDAAKAAMIEEILASNPNTKFYVKGSVSNIDNYDNPEEKYVKVEEAIDGSTDKSAFQFEGYTNSSGILTMTGVGVGTYTIEELIAPDGYNLLQAPITVVVSFDPVRKEFTATVDGANSGYESTTNTITFNVINNQGVELPETGGMGTVLFVTIGAILFMAAGIVLTAKKRLYNEG